MTEQYHSTLARKAQLRVSAKNPREIRLDTFVAGPLGAILILNLYQYGSVVLNWSSVTYHLI